jgi:hypothetical protein
LSIVLTRGAARGPGVSHRNGSVDRLQWSSGRRHPMPRSSFAHRLATLVTFASIAACGGQADVTVNVSCASSDGGATTTPPPPDGGATATTPPRDGGAPSSYCVTAPWTDSPAQFVANSGDKDLPAGAYMLRYVGGAQMHDATEGYEVTAHYTIDGIQAGHHLFNGATLASSKMDVWLSDSGTVGSLPSVSAVEEANAGHTWTFAHAGGPLYITYLDNAYSDNRGPGSRFCADAAPASAPAPVCAGTTKTMEVPATAPWLDTGLDIVAGSRLTIKASGTVTYGTLPEQVSDANGGNYDGTKYFADDVLPPPTIVSSLIGKTGGSTDVGSGTPVPGTPDGGPGFIGTSYDHVVPTSGRLFLGYNDQIPDFGDNSGAFTVTVTITCA